MERERVKSSMIASLGYDPVAEVLEVEFTPKANQESGPVYQYLKFSARNWDDLRHAESLGKHFTDRVKGKFGHRRVADGVEKAVEKQESA